MSSGISTAFLTSNPGQKTQQMMGIQSLISFFIFSVISFSSVIHAQQPYAGKATTDCNRVENSTSVLGYTCNGQNSRCQGYLIFRSQPPYTTVSAISTLLGSDPSQLSRINSVSVTENFQTNKEVIVPINCSCSGEYYQANASYVTKHEDNYFLIANNTFQGLSTCQTLQDQNQQSTRNLFTGTRINVPLRCACPTKEQADKGVKYLLSYIITWGEFVSSIALRFGVDTGSTLEANKLSEQESTIYPFTTLLVPLQNSPLSSQTTTPPPPPPSSPPPSPPAAPANKKKKKWIYVAIGVAAAAVLLVVFSIIVFCTYMSKTKRSKADSVNISENFKSIEKPLVKMPEEKSNEFLDGLNEIAQSMKVYEFQELQKATDNFSSSNWIKGSVYRGVINGDVAAIKKMDGDVSKELNLLKKINHFNLIRLSGVCFNEGHWYLVYEYAVNGSLTDWMYNSKNDMKVLSWTQRVQIALDIATGLNYLHSYTNPPHVHKDIKSSNVLLDDAFRAKIANFGLARSAEGMEGEFALTRHIVGTKGYMAPEYLENGLVSPKLDVYSFGVVMLEMVTGKEAVVAWEGGDMLLSETLAAMLRKEKPNENLKDIIDPSLQQNYPLDLALVMAKLIENCLRRDPADRPGMDEIVQSLSKISATSLAWESSNSASGSDYLQYSSSSSREPYLENR